MSQALKDLLDHEETSDFLNENLPVRICFAKHLRYAADKLKRPDFFCWPAMFMADHGMWAVDVNESLRLFTRHQPLFLASLSGEIRPALFGDRPMENVVQAFNDFYMWIVQYDLVDQWIVRDGGFNLDFPTLAHVSRQITLRVPLINITATFGVCHLMTTTSFRKTISRRIKPHQRVAA